MKPFFSNNQNSCIDILGSPLLPYSFPCQQVPAFAQETPKAQICNDVISYIGVPPCALFPRGSQFHWIRKQKSVISIGSKISLRVSGYEGAQNTLSHAEKVRTELWNDRIFVTDGDGLLLNGPGAFAAGKYSFDKSVANAAMEYASNTDSVAKQLN